MELQSPPWWIKTLIVLVIMVAILWAGMKEESAEHYPPIITQETTNGHSR